MAKNYQSKQSNVVLPTKTVKNVLFKMSVVPHSYDKKTYEKAIKTVGTVTSDAQFSIFIKQNLIFNRIISSWSIKKIMQEVNNTILSLSILWFNLLFPSIWSLWLKFSVTGFFFHSYCSNGYGSLHWEWSDVSNVKKNF